MDAIAAQLSALPPSVNPYLALASVLRTQLTPPAPDAFETGLFVSQGFFAVATALGLLVRPVDRTIRLIGQVIAFRVASGSCWIYRFRPTPAGTLFVFNAPLAWLVCFAAYGPIVQGLIVVTRHVYFEGSSSVALTKQLDAIGLAVLSTGLWANAYELSAATFARYSNTFKHLRAWHVHAAFAIVPVFEATVLVVLLVSADRLNKTVEILATLSTQLAAQPWSPGEAFALDPTSAWVPTLLAFSAQVARFVTLEKAGYALITADFIANSLIVVPATLMQVNILRRHASASSRAVAAFLTSHQSAAPLLNSRRWAMRANIYALTAEAIGVLILTLAVSGVTAWIAVDLDAIIASGKLLAGAYLTVFMTVSILVTPVHCLLLWQAVRAWRRSRLGNRASPAIGLTITTETKVEIDDGFGTRSFDSTVEAQDHVSISLAAMHRERTGLALRADISASHSLGARPHEVFVLPRPMPLPKDEDEFDKDSPRSVKFETHV